MTTRYDIAVIGGGPAGLSAALTGRVRNKSIGLFEHLGFSDKLKKAHLVDNYLGLPHISGANLMEQFLTHASAHNPSIIREKVINLFLGDDYFTLLTTKGTYEAKTVIIATGVVSTTLFAGERKFLGRGVSYCATCDGMFYKGKNVAVISYTPDGEHEAKFLSEICRRVYYIPRYKDAVQNMATNVEVLYAVPESIEGNQTVEHVATNTGDIKVDGVFILRQSDPVENILPGLMMDEEVIKVNRDMSTNMPGVFAAGDCTGRPWQIAKAVGEGLIAALSAVSYLEQREKKA